MDVSTFTAAAFGGLVVAHIILTSRKTYQFEDSRENFLDVRVWFGGWARATRKAFERNPDVRRGRLLGQYGYYPWFDVNLLEKVNG